MNDINEGVSIGIVRIKDISFIINEALFRGEEDLISIDFLHKVFLKPDDNLLVFTLKVSFYYADARIRENILETEIENVFFIEDLSKYMNDKGEATFAEMAWITIVSLSVSHSRALIARNCAGTVLQKTLVPIINPADLARSFFSKPVTGNNLKEGDSILESVK